MNEGAVVDRGYLRASFGREPAEAAPAAFAHATHRSWHRWSWWRSPDPGLLASLAPSPATTDGVVGMEDRIDAIDPKLLPRRHGAGGWAEGGRSRLTTWLERRDAAPGRSLLGAVVVDVVDDLLRLDLGPNTPPLELRMVDARTTDAYMFAVGDVGVQVVPDDAGTFSGDLPRRHGRWLRRLERSMARELEDGTGGD